MIKTYISPDILNWWSDSGGGSYGDVDQIRWSYDAISHVRQNLRNNPSQHTRADVITALQRIVERRKKYLNEVYAFRRMPGCGRRPAMEVMESFGIIQPLMIRKLAELRNRVEHQFSDPPTTEVCEELWEFVWYFLRSTDRFINLIADSVNLFAHKPVWTTTPMVEVIISPSAWSTRSGPLVPISIRGDVPHELVSAQHVANWLEVRSELPALPRPLDDPMASTCRQVGGTAALTEAQLTALIRLYLQAA